MFRKNRAFTLVEIMLAVTVIAVIAVLTVGNREAGDSRRMKKNIAVSQGFYSNLVTSYQHVLIKYGTGSANRITASNDKTKSELMRNHILEFLDGENTDCTDLKNIATSTKGKSFVSDKMACFITPAKIVGGVYFDTSCNHTYEIKETTDLENPNQYKKVTNSCGYILYGLTDSKGEYGKDLFTIAFGERNVKK